MKTPCKKCKRPCRQDQLFAGTCAPCGREGDRQIRMKWDAVRKP